MKKYFFLTLVLFATAFFCQTVRAQTEAQRIDLCTRAAGADARFLQSYVIQLDAAREGQRPPDQRNPVAFIKGNRYRITVCTDEESAGEAIVQIYDEGRVIASNLTSDGRILTSVELDINKTAPYVIRTFIKDGRQGSAVVIVSHVRTL